MSGACSPPSPSSPWQVTHFASKMLFPLEELEFREGADSSLSLFWQTALPIAPKNTGHERGLYQLESIELYSCFPFGIAWWCRKFESNKNLLDAKSEAPKPIVTVYPPMEQVEGNFLYRIRASTDSPMGLLSNRRPTNAVSSSVRGLREFLHGDSIRLIHWPSSARTGRLLVREFEAEGLPGFDLLLNLTTPWRSADQFELAVSVTYSLLQLGFKLGGAPELFLIKKFRTHKSFFIQRNNLRRQLPAIPSAPFFLPFC